MTDLALIQQTEQSLAAIKAFASQSNNGQLLEHIQRLEAALKGISTGGGAITVGDISGSTAVAIGHDINIIINQALPPAVRQPLENVQKQWGAAHLEVRQALERGQGGHVFLSYTRADMEAALQIRRALEQAGHVVWQDLTAIKGGDEWIKSIETGVERSYALVMVVSAASQKSEWVQIEYLHAKRRGKLIVPIRVDGSEIPTVMLAMNVVQGFPDLEAGLGQLLASLPAPAGIQKEAPADRRALELRYLDKLLLEHSVWQEVYTPMAGVGQLRAPKETPKPGVRMKTTPTTIDVGYLGQRFGAREDTAERFGEAEPRQYAADITGAVAEMRQLVILGDPGAGKTTTLWKILSDCALRAREDPQAPLPALVRLGSLGPDGLEQGLRQQLGALWPWYEDLLREKRLVFLLDGLNEMTSAGREANLAAIRKLLDTCRRANLTLAVTCRELDYTAGLDLNLPGRVTIQPLDPPRIRRFVNAYIDEPGRGDELFWQLAGGAEVEKVWEKWEQAGASLELFFTAPDVPKENPNVYNSTSGQDDTTWRERVHGNRNMVSLAANPYMLYMITQVFTRAGALPANRGLLFQTFIDYLLEQRERLSPDAAAQLKARLAELAYAMQSQGEGTAFSVQQAMKHLRDQASLYQARSASLLAGGDDQVRFTHQLLQEYFAAHRLQNLMVNTSAGTLFPKENWWEPQGWEETLILLAGLYSDDCSPVIAWLREAQPEVAARCIAESGAHCPDSTLADLRSLWIPRLTNIQHDPSPLARAALGRALGRLSLNGQPLDNRKSISIFSPPPAGDPLAGAGGLGVRAGVRAAGESLPDLDWVEIPAGPFTYQDKERREEALFFMARYPVTFAQFQLFLDDPQGFGDPRWWQGLAASEEHRRAPGEQAFKFSNHPRERVSWYDAVAFCRWLTEKARMYPQLLPAKLAGQAGCVIRLPTEWQWEKAARGADGDGREYPYPGKFDAEKANTAETGIGQTSAAGIFPQGASPYGVEELSGNLWEWCLNEYEKPQNIGLGGDASRVLRGGSWVVNQGLARSSYRFGYLPDLRNYDVGFRVVVLPPSLRSTGH